MDERRGIYYEFEGVGGYKDLFFSFEVDQDFMDGVG